MKAADVMTTNVITVGPDACVQDVARVLLSARISGVPVVEGGKVVGIVSRANLLQALAGQTNQIEVATEVNDSQIRDKVLTQLNAEPWLRPSLVNVIVQDGTVELWGIVESASEKKAVRIAAEVTPGVRAVNDNLIVRPAQWGY